MEPRWRGAEWPAFFHCLDLPKSALVSLTTLERVAAGQADAVEECLRKYRGLVWSLARKLCPNLTDAEDAVQEIFIEVWRHADRFDAGRASEATYIATIARRRLIDKYRRRSRQVETAAMDESVEGSRGHPRNERRPTKRRPGHDASWPNCVPRSSRSLNCRSSTA